MRHTITVFLDIIAVLALGVATFIAVTGGGVFDIEGMRVSATTATNPIIAGALTLALRCWLRPTSGLFATRFLSPQNLSERLNRLIGGPLAPSWPVRRAWVGLAGLLCLSVALRTLNALHPGFITGDDVEVHELTLSTLFGYQWDIWSLRNAFFPLTFVFPAQALLSGMGISSMEALVFAGRLSVLVWATGSIVLLYRIAVFIDGSRAVGLLAAGLFATSRLHLWFGSTELPRPVAAVFLLAAFYVLLRFRSSVSAIVAGALVGLAAALRFGEIVFIVPSALHLALQRRHRDSVLVLCSAGMTAAMILCAVDAWYWSDPLHSVTSIVRYTLVDRQSSRGFQPWWHYIGRFGEWTTLPVLLASLFALSTRRWAAAFWGWSALLLLSCLPHKEARYMIAIQPFVCLAAAGVVVDLIRELRLKGRDRQAAIVVVVTVFCVCLELANWRIRRSDAGVRIAHTIAADGVRGVAAEQLWRLGGRLYLRDVPTVIELTDPSASAISEVVGRPGLEQVVLVRYSVSEEVTTALNVAGFKGPLIVESEYLVYSRGRRH